LKYIILKVQIEILSTVQKYNKIFYKNIYKNLRNKYWSFNFLFLLTQPENISKVILNTYYVLSDSLLHIVK